MTGFPPKVRQIITDRAGGRCERCTAWNGVEIHHRRPRAMGGSRDPMTNAPANGVLLCTTCHRWIESHREQALSNGWLVRQGQDPSVIPILYHDAHPALLTEQGTIRYE